MVAHPQARPLDNIRYPNSDGQPMADNTQQFQWIVTIKENLEILFAAKSEVFVAGDLLWYPVEGNNRLCQAPDVMVVLGRPKGDRGSYRQWREENIAPQVVFSSETKPSSGRNAWRHDYGSWGLTQIRFSKFLQTWVWQPFCSGSR